jgi:hypothetical protein
MNAKKLPPQIVGNAGLFFVCHRLSQLGWNAMPTSRNARGVDVMCFSLDGKNTLLLQVKSLSRRKAPVPLGKDVEGFMGDYWIIVTEATADKPTCYILTPEQVRSMAHKGEKDGRISCWLPHKRYAVEEFCEQWNRIGPGCCS